MEKIFIRSDKSLEETAYDLRKEHSARINWFIGLGVVLVVVGLLWNIKLPLTKHYESKQYRFSLDYPADWAVFENIIKQSAVAFIPPKEKGDKKDALIDAVSFVFLDMSRQPMTLDQFVKVGIENFRISSGGSFTILESKPIPIGGLPGHVFSFIPKSGQMAGMRFVVYSAIRGTKAITITYLGQKESFGRNSRKVKKMVESLKFF